MKYRKGRYPVAATPLLVFAACADPHAPDSGEDDTGPAHRRSGRQVDGRLGRVVVVSVRRGARVVAHCRFGRCRRRKRAACLHDEHDALLPGPPPTPGRPAIRTSSRVGQRRQCDRHGVTGGTAQLTVELGPLSRTAAVTSGPAPVSINGAGMMVDGAVSRHHRNRAGSGAAVRGRCRHIVPQFMLR